MIPKSLVGDWWKPKNPTPNILWLVRMADNGFRPPLCSYVQHTKTEATVSADQHYQSQADHQALLQTNSNDHARTVQNDGHARASNGPRGRCSGKKKGGYRLVCLSAWRDRHRPRKSGNPKFLWHERCYHPLTHRCAPRIYLPQIPNRTGAVGESKRLIQNNENPTWKHVTASLSSRSHHPFAFLL